jgi:hypothetical protein
MFDVSVTMLEMRVVSRCLFLANDMTQAFPLLLENVGRKFAQRFLSA